MGVDYNAVGGIGIEFTPDLRQQVEDFGFFTEKEWEEDYDKCLSKIGLPYNLGGDGSYGGEDYYFFLVKGKTLIEVLANSPDFIDVLSKVGISITMEDLRVISELYIY